MVHIQDYIKECTLSKFETKNDKQRGEKVMFCVKELLRMVDKTVELYSSPFNSISPYPKSPTQLEIAVTRFFYTSHIDIKFS